MLEFMYTNCLPVTMDCIALVNLLHLADSYQLPGLFDVCVERIPSAVDKSSIVEVVSCLSLLRAARRDCEKLLQWLIRNLRQDPQLLDFTLSSGESNRGPWVLHD